MDDSLRPVLHIGRKAVVFPGPYGTAVGQRVAAIKNAVDEFERVDADLRASDRLSRDELEQRHNRNRTVLATAVEKEAKALADARWEHRSAMRSASVVTPGSKTDYYVALVDVELRAGFKALPIAERTQLVARMLDEPVPHLRLLESLLRAPELNLLPEGVPQALQAGLVARLKPSEFAALDVQAAQINGACQAVGIACDRLAEAGFNPATNLPAAHKLVYGAESAPLKWLPSGVDQRYAPAEALAA